MALVAVIDPDPRGARAIERALRTAGNAILAAHGTDPLGAMVDLAELVVLHLGRDGEAVHLLRRLVCLAPYLPIVVVVAAERPGDVVTALNAGAVDAMVLPGRNGELAARVRRRLYAASA